MKQKASKNGMTAINATKLVELAYGPWIKAATKENVIEAFKKTGYVPFDPSVILNGIAVKTSDASALDMAKQNRIVLGKKEKEVVATDMEIAGFDRIKERQTIYFDENASLKEVYKSTLSILDSRHGGQIAIDFMKHNLQLMSDYLPLFLEYQGRVIAEHQTDGTALYDKPSPELIDKLV